MSGGPRNRVALARGQRYREEIRQFLASRSQTLPTPTADDIRSRLALPISRRMTQEYIRRIQVECQDAIDRAARNSSNSDSPLDSVSTIPEISA